MQLYREESYHAKYNAQRNLSGRTHYVDDDTLRFHHSRIQWANPVCNGLMFALIESYAADYQNTTRRFRYVVFDLVGNVISRCALEDGWRSTEKARKAMYDYLNSIDEYEVSRQSVERYRESCNSECERMLTDIENNRSKYAA